MNTRQILLIPGLRCTADLFAPQVAALSRDYDCTVADHSRGATIAEIAASILADAPARFALAGLSLGGYIALEIMRQAPGRVERLALLSTQATPESDEARERRLPLIALAQGGRFHEVEAQTWPTAVHPSRIADAALRAVSVKMGEDTGAETWLRHVSAVMAREDARPRLAAIRVPTLVLVGADDQITPPERAREMVMAITTSRLVVVPDCGHLSSLERPAEVSAALADWMTWRE